MQSLLNYYGRFGEFTVMQQSVSCAQLFFVTMFTTSNNPSQDWNKNLENKNLFFKISLSHLVDPPCMRSDHRSSGHVSQLHLSIDPHSWLEKRENHLWSSSAVKHFQYWPYFFSFLTGGFVMTHGSPSSKRATMKNFEGWQLPLDKTEEKKKLEQVSFELGVYACTEEEFYAALSQSKMQWKECSGWLCGAPRRKGHPA